VPLLPVIVTVRAEVTADVVTMKVALVAPAATVTDAGTWATAVRLLVNVTTIPPVGAGPFSVTVPVDEVPPLTVLGIRRSVDNVGALTVSVALCVTLL